jgi:hypothetical protein
MKYSVVIKSPEGEKIELVTSDNDDFSEGALIGARALLALLQDDMDLEDGYFIEKVSGRDSSDEDSRKPFSEMFD